MIALLVHFLGHLLVDSAIPPWVGSADSYFLACWYAGFAAVDVIAASLSTGRIRLVLALSFAWSAALTVEQMLMLDTLQRNDWIMQSLVDGALMVCLVIELCRWRQRQGAF